MFDQGNISLSEEGRRLLGMEEQAVQAEPVPAAPGAAQTFGAALSGILGSQFTGNPAIAQSVMGTLENRRRGAEAGAAEKVGLLRDLRQKEVAMEMDMAERAQDTKLALTKAKELDKLEQERKDEERRKDEKFEKDKLGIQHQNRLNEIRETSSGRITLAQKNAELKQLASDYGVPKHVAQAMQDARNGISANTARYIASAGSLGQVDPEELARLQAAERIQHRQSDEEIIARYERGEFGQPAATVAATTAAPKTPAPQTTAAEDLAAHQARMRAAVTGTK